MISDELVGRFFKNNADQSYQVVRFVGRKKNGTSLFRIRFIETGYERDVEKVEIKRGKIKDRFQRSVFGVGYLGDTKMVGYKREYSVWAGILERCYDKSSSGYPNYGGAGVSVCERWHSFELFLKDITDIEGFDRELFDQGKLELDKDIKQFDLCKSKRVYSAFTCCFVTREINRKYRDVSATKLLFKATSPSGESFTVPGLRPFAAKHGLHRPTIKKCLRGERADYNGWTFELIRESNWGRSKSA
ncbi:hypothetical protein ABH16_04730 [Bacillus altitudinis]|uniref:hypothetical protein n=1 Tax=Bacillus altitudinis TaxID=293387 RepID=UPI0018CE87D8|nr:hypothetical protein [Bacillus altitudinis]MBG9901833.1 hypothetical protein [Bacillus altitudinis]